MIIQLMTDSSLYFYL